MKKVNNWVMSDDMICKNDKYFKGHCIQNQNGVWDVLYNEIFIKSFSTLSRAIKHIES